MTDAVLAELDRDAQYEAGAELVGLAAGFLAATVLGGQRVLRVTVMNPRSTEAHVHALLDGLATGAGQRLKPGPA